MTTVDMHNHARRLLETYGPKASLIAAQKARSFEDQGDKAQAGTWRKLESTILAMRSADVG